MKTLKETLIFSNGDRTFEGKTSLEILKSMQDSDYEVSGMTIKDYKTVILERMGFFDEDFEPVKEGLNKIIESSNHDQFVKLCQTWGILKRLYRVFVYGSLMEGFGNHSLLYEYGGERKREKDAWVDNVALYAYSSFPMAISKFGLRTKGEVYLVGKQMLDCIDRLEGHPRFYTRQTMKAKDGRITFIYLGTKNIVKGKKLIESGIWTQDDAMWSFKSRK